MDQKSGFTEQMPTSIGRYQVQGSIGYGAMGAVYKAFDPLIKRTLAIKTIRLDIPRNSPQYKSFIERFYHEARISGTLSHPNIVTLFDIGEEAGIPYLAMEFVEGDTIASMIEKGQRFPPEKVISVVSQAAAAIDYAHSKGVIHRDIKPSNMMLSEGDRVKVTDFGIAKLVDAEMTQAGQLLGTPSYMSPEQAMGDKLDGRSDIFSLGVCAFEMLCGEQPFPGTNVTSILYKLVHVDPIEPANLELNGLVPQKWHEVFNKVLAKKPDDRYQTAAQFVQDLEYCLGSWFGAVSESTLEPTMGIPAIPAPPALGKAEAARPQPPRSEPPRPAAPTAAPVPPAIEATARIPVAAVAPPQPPSSPAVADLDATIPRQPRASAPAAAPAPPPAASGAFAPTVHMKAPRDEDMATVAMLAPAVPEATVKVAVPKPAVPPVAPPSPPAARVATAKAAPPARPAPPPPTAPPATAPMPTPPPATSAPGGRKGLSPLAVLGGAALFLLVALTLAGVLWMRQRRGPGVPSVVSPPPIVEATPEPAATPTPGPVTGDLHVETVPAGAAVSVNGEAKGAAPIDVTGLPIGNYEVRAELRGYEPKSETVAVVVGAASASVKLSLTRTAPVNGTVEIVSDPAGGGVSIDGVRGGETPIAELRLKPGSHKIEIQKDGFEPWNGSVTIEAGKKASVRAALTAILKATPPPTPKPEVVDPNRIYLNAPSEVDTPAKKLSGPSVSYPEGAPRLKSGDSVSVSVSFVVDENGDVQDAKTTESAGKTIDDAVLAAIRKWKYQPALKLGVKVKVKIGFKQTFRAG
jgi:serine/threonine-protein kinase